MNRQFSFKDASRAPPADQPRIPANWTDQRVQQIMKKYETPISKLNQPLQQNRRPYAQAHERSPLRQNSNNSSFIEPRNAYTPGKNCRRTEEKSDKKNYDRDYQLGNNYQRPMPSQVYYQENIEIYQKKPESLTSQFWKERENTYDPDTYNRSKDKPQIREIYNREENSSYLARDRKSSFNQRDISFNQRDNYRQREVQPMNQPYSYAHRLEPTISPQKDYRRVDYKLQHTLFSRQSMNQTQNRTDLTRHRQSYNQAEGLDWTPTRKTSTRVVTETNEREPGLKYTPSHAAFEQSPVIKPSIKKSVNKIEYDSRISNIERINQKIKRILAAAGDGDNISRQGRSLDIAARPSLSPFTQKDNPYKRDTQTVSRLKVGQIESSSRITQKEQKTPELNKNSKISNKSHKKEANGEKENINYLPETREYRKDWQCRKQGLGTRSKSCIMKDIKIQKVDPCGAKQDKNNRIQEQILNFNNKIAELQAEKKKLNINFNPNNSTQVLNATPSRSYLNNNSPAATPSVKKEALKQEEPKPSKRQEKVSEFIYETPVSTQRFQEESQLQPPQCLIPVIPAEGLIEESMCEPDYDFSKDAIAQSPFVDFKDALNMGDSQAEFQFCTQEELRNNVATRIEDRRRRLQALQQSSVGQSRAGNSETKRFLGLLSEQVKLDQQFRLTKNWFVNCDLTNKYPLLQSILAARWREMSIEEIDSDFRVNFEEDDPFYSYREDQFQLEDLVNNYIICNSHWQQHLQQQWNVQQLAQEGLLRSLDLEGKQYVAIEDLVRVINMEEGTFYRNRDLYLVYQRLTANNKNEQLRMDLFCAALAQRG